MDGSRVYARKHHWPCSPEHIFHQAQPSPAYTRPATLPRCWSCNTLNANAHSSALASGNTSTLQVLATVSIQLGHRRHLIGTRRLSVQDAHAWQAHTRACHPWPAAEADPTAKEGISQPHQAAAGCLRVGSDANGIRIQGKVIVWVWHRHTPLFLRAEPQSTGTAAAFSVARRMPSSTACPAIIDAATHHL